MTDPYADQPVPSDAPADGDVETTPPGDDEEVAEDDEADESSATPDA